MRTLISGYPKHKRLRHFASCWYVYVSPVPLAAVGNACEMMHVIPKQRLVLDIAILRLYNLTWRLLLAINSKSINFFGSYYDTLSTTLQFIMNAKLSLQGFWHCHKNRLIKTIQMIPHNLYVSFKSDPLYCGLRLIPILNKGKLT